LKIVARICGRKSLIREPARKAVATGSERFGKSLDRHPNAGSEGNAYEGLVRAAFRLHHQRLPPFWLGLRRRTVK
jgi:hypothetical protein